MLETDHDKEVLECMQGKEDSLHNMLEEADLSVMGMIAVLGGISPEVVVHHDDADEKRSLWWDHPKKEAAFEAAAAVAILLHCHPHKEALKRCDDEVGVEAKNRVNANAVTKELKSFLSSL